MTGLIKFDFHGDTLDVVQDESGVWVAVKRVCESLGLDRAGQQKKLQNKPWAVGDFKSLTAADGRNYETFCIHLDSLPMWLATIEPSRVAATVRPKLERYQRECARVLRDHFLGVPRQQPALDEERIVALCVRAAVSAVQAIQSDAARMAAPCLGRSMGTVVNAKLRDAARRMAPDDARAYRSTLQTITMDLRSALNFSGTGRGWADFPMHRWPELKAKLEELARLSSRVGANRQLAIEGT